MASSPEPDLDATEELDDDMFPESGLDAPAPSTPRQSSSHLPPVSELSPPHSQPRTTGTTSLSNTNNNRAAAALDIVSNSTVAATATNGSTTKASMVTGVTGQLKVHEPTGYQWVRPEDEPGYTWRNRKAQEEAMKALDQIVDKDKMIGARYGDLLLEQQTARQKA